MSVREALNKNKGVGAAAAGALLCVAVAAIAWEFHGNGPQQITKVFYSVDDGKTWFTDDADKVSPFDYNGQQAYKVDVFKTSSGTEFVGIIERYTDEAKSKLAQLRALPPDQQNPQEIQAVVNSGLQVKRPGDTKWCLVNSSQGASIMAVRSPEGGPAIGVLP